MHGRLVIADKVIEATVIKDVVATAGVSRGTFSNHFGDVQDLMPAARDALVDEWLDPTLSAVMEVEDPAQSCAIGLRVALKVARDCPMLARLHLMIGTNFLPRGNLVSVLLPPLMQRGIRGASGFRRWFCWSIALPRSRLSRFYGSQWVSPSICQR